MCECVRVAPRKWRILIDNLPNDIKLHLLTDAFKDFGNIVNSSLEYEEDVLHFLTVCSFLVIGKDIAVWGNSVFTRERCRTSD